MISSLELTNWRSHSNTRLEFGKGTNLIVGIMGSGKSAVLDAVSYALFGTSPALKRRSLSSTDLIRHGESELAVALEFSFGENKYRVERKLRASKKGAEVVAKLYENGKLLETGQSRVTSLVEEKLGMGFDLFDRAIYSEQNNIDYFLQLDPGRRKKEMDRLMGLDRFESARESAVRVANRLASERKALEREYDSSKHSQLLSEKEAKQSALSEMEKRGEKLRSESESYRQECGKLEKKAAEMKALKEKRQKLSSECERCTARVEALSAELEKKEFSKEKISGLEEKKAGLEKRALESSSRLSEMQKELSLLTKNEGELQSRLDNSLRLSGEKEKLSSQLAETLQGGEADSLPRKEQELEKEVLFVSATIEKLKAEAGELEVAAGELRKAKGNCPVCDTELSAEKASALSKEKEALSGKKLEDAEAANSKLFPLEKTLSGIKERNRKAALLQGRLAAISPEQPEALKKELEGLRTQAAEKSSRREKAAEEKEKLAAEVRELFYSIRSMMELLQKSELLSKEKERAAALRKELGQIPFSEEEYEKLSSAFREASVKREKAVAELSHAERERASAVEYLKLLGSRISELEKAKSRAERLGKLVEELTIYRNAVTETQAEMRTELVEAITGAMNEIWPILYPHGDYTRLRIAADEKDYRFELFDGEWRSLERVASGGERACLSLTLRIALATVLAPEINWLILDEPTHNLDRDAVQTLSEALEQKVPQLVDQAFVITHEENLMNSEFARSYKFIRKKDEGGPTSVEEL